MPIWLVYNKYIHVGYLCKLWQLNSITKSQLTELTSVKPEVDSLGVLLDADDGMKGSFPLNGSPRPFLAGKWSMTSAPKAWKGSHGLEGSAVAIKLTGVVVPGDKIQLNE